MDCLLDTPQWYVFYLLSGLANLSNFTDMRSTDIRHQNRIEFPLTAADHARSISVSDFDWQLHGGYQLSDIDAALIRNVPLEFRFGIFARDEAEAYRTAGCSVRQYFTGAHASPIKQSFHRIPMPKGHHRLRGLKLIGSFSTRQTISGTGISHRWSVSSQACQEANCTLGISSQKQL